jgi:hypothetical protein
MKDKYFQRLLLIFGAMAAITAICMGMKWAVLPGYNWLGLVFLVAVTGLIHLFVGAAKDNANSLIRRMMVGSMLRMFLGILFLAITLYNKRPVNLHFVIFYCSYFSILMVFEISQMRTNLRPDLKQRPNNANA